jgi:3-hydroxyacyl-CoA dehydrogenase
MKFYKAAVVGAGAMGSGIAQVLSQAGLQVVLKDIETSYVEKGLANIKRMYDSRVKKEVLTQAEADSHFAKIKGTTGFDGFEEVDLVIEAALEEIEIKLKVFRELDRICPAHAILATNTSALSISEIASATKRPDKVVGMHFFNPAHIMKLVEVIPGVKTSEETVTAAIDLCRKMQKNPIKVEECPGFLVNRLLFPYLNEALYVLQEGKHGPEEIDKAAVEFGLPMGPLTLLDMTGVDVCFHVNQFLSSQYGLRFKTSPLLKKLMDNRFLGQKSGAGIYQHTPGKIYGKDEKREINPGLAKLLTEIGGNGSAANEGAFDVYRIIMPMFNEAVFALQEKVVAVNDVDLAMADGIGLKRGLLSIAKENSLSFCYDKLNELAGIHGERFHPAWYLGKLANANIHDFSELLTGEVAAVR